MSQARHLHVQPSAEDSIQQAALQVPDHIDARLSAVLDVAGEAIALLAADATILGLNAACERAFGWAERDLMGLRLDALLEADLDEHALRLAGSGRFAVGRHRNGTAFPVEIRSAALGGGDASGFVVALRDLRDPRVAAERHAKLEAEHARIGRTAALDQMGAALAHELNQPLTAAALYLQAAEKMVGSDAPVAAIVAKARREAERAAGIIRSMREFVENRPPEHRVVALDPLVDEAVELAMTGQVTTIGIRRSIQAPCLMVLADPIQLQQIVVNLVRNAAEAVEGRDDAWVAVISRQDGSEARLTVTDNGPGIPEARLADIFKPFTSSKTGGLGLGLAISRSIAERHGGEITVVPRGNGEGAAFSLVLPVAAHTPSTADPRRS